MLSTWTSPVVTLFDRKEAAGWNHVNSHVIGWIHRNDSTEQESRTGYGTATVSRIPTSSTTKVRALDRIPFPKCTRSIYSVIDNLQCAASLGVAVTRVAKIRLDSSTRYSGPSRTAQTRAKRERAAHETIFSRSVPTFPFTIYNRHHVW